MIGQFNILNVSIPTKYSCRLNAIQITILAGIFVEIYKLIREHSAKALASTRAFKAEDISVSQDPMETGTSSTRTRLPAGAGGESGQTYQAVLGGPC